MNNEKIEQLEEVKSNATFNNKQEKEKKEKKGLPIWFVIASMIFLALVIGGFLIVGEMVAKEKGYGSGSEIFNNPQEDDKLDHTISINEYEFELGVKLDEFLTNTGTIIEEKDLEIAKTNGDLYGEVSSSITKDGEVTKFKIYVNASNKENITIQGIKIESDRAFIGKEQVIRKDLNLVAIDVMILNKYDVNKTTFDDLDLETQKLAKKTTIKGRSAYELKLKDSAGFEIKITFVSNEEDEYYFTFNVDNDFNGL